MIAIWIMKYPFKLVKIVLQLHKYFLLTKYKVHITQVIETAQHSVKVLISAHILLYIAHKNCVGVLCNFIKLLQEIRGFSSHDIGNRHEVNGYELVILIMLC